MEIEIDTNIPYESNKIFNILFEMKFKYSLNPLS